MRTGQLPDVGRLRNLARILDAGLRVPGTRWEIGLDPLIGLVPGIGDLLGGAGSAYILLQAARWGASSAVLGRMLINVAVDAIIGSLPVLGDIFDATWKANLRNVALLERYLADPRGAHRASRGMLALVGGGVTLVGLAAVAGTLLLLRAGLRLLLGR